MKKVYKHPRVIIFILIASLFFSVFVLSSCHKQPILNSVGNSNFVMVSQSWFESNIVSKEKELLLTPYSVLPKKASSRIFARMGKIEKLLDWKEAKQFKSKDVTFIIVPINEDLKPFQNKNFEASRCLIFYRDKSVKINMYVEEILSDKNTSLGDNIQEIMRLAFVNKYSGQNNNVTNVNLNVIFYNEDYNYESSFKVLDGRWSKNKFIIQNRNSKANNRIINTVSRIAGCGGCQTYYTVGTLYYIDTGEIISQEILGSYQEGDGCDVGGSGDPYGSGEGDGSQDQQDCLNQCQSNSDELSSGVSTASETTNTNISAVNDHTKYKNPKWTCLKGTGWILSSQEIGIIKLVDVQANKWVWNSLTHSTINMTGMPVGGTVTPNTGTGTPSFVAGTPNVLYAGMSLNFDVKYSVVCNCGGFAPSYTLNYISTSTLWNANPF